MTIIAAADGSALGNPGPSGWGWFVDHSCWASGGWAHGTNNMGELMAVLDLLQQTAHADEDLLIYCDSTYVINTVTKWMAGWKRRGWKKGDGKPVMNLELIKAIDEAMRPGVRFEWVKGHTGHPLNEEADRLANAAAAAFRDGVAPDSGPGFAGAAERGAAPQSAPSAPPAPEPDLFSDFEEEAPSDFEQVVALERALLTDQVRDDAAAVAALLHPDWQEIGRSGRLWERDVLLGEIGAIEPMSLEVVSIDRVGPDAVLLVWRAVSDDRTTLRSSLWVRSGAGWVQRFHQGTDEL